MLMIEKLDQIAADCGATRARTLPGSTYLFEFEAQECSQVNTPNLAPVLMVQPDLGWTFDLSRGDLDLVLKPYNILELGPALTQNVKDVCELFEIDPTNVLLFLEGVEKTFDEVPE